ncbi:YggS family pyridoxal phosphate-dependent enzyme [bacterium]|nr:YggS family pyridoxal phosphate-dependent enzyme [bacterium]
MRHSLIKEKVREFLSTLPPDVLLVAAAKTRTSEEVMAAVEAGITALGYNYVQEAQSMYEYIGEKVQWHMIGHLQRNKAKKAVELFDMIETVDSLKLAQTISHRCTELGKTMSVLLQINSGREPNKAGVFPEEVDKLATEMSGFDNICVQGLMTMGPLFGDPEDSRPFFRETRAAFERLAGQKIPNIEMRYLSMGMSSSYQVALEEGANVIRIGTKLFGERKPKTESAMP